MARITEASYVSFFGCRERGENDIKIDDQDILKDLKHGCQSLGFSFYILIFPRCFWEHDQGSTLPVISTVVVEWKA